MSAWRGRRPLYSPAGLSTPSATSACRSRRLSAARAVQGPAPSRRPDVLAPVLGRRVAPRPPIWGPPAAPLTADITQRRGPSPLDRSMRREESGRAYSIRVSPLGGSDVPCSPSARNRIAHGGRPACSRRSSSERHASSSCGMRHYYEHRLQHWYQQRRKRRHGQEQLQLGQQRNRGLVLDTRSALPLPRRVAEHDVSRVLRHNQGREGLLARPLPSSTAEVGGLRSMPRYAAL